MRSWAKQCAGVALAIAVPFFPAVGAPSGSLVQSSSQPFLPTASATRAARALDVVAPIAPQRTQQPPLEAMRSRGAAITASTTPSTSRPSKASAASSTQPLLTIIVEEGQTPWQLAMTHGVSVEALLGANGLRSSDVIQIGQRLTVPQVNRAIGNSPGVVSPAASLPQATAISAGTKRPTPETHIVSDGETLWAISQLYGVSVEAVASANGLAEEALIHRGLKLSIPAPGTPTPAAGTVKPKALTVSQGTSTTVVIEPGQTLWSISRAYGVTVEAIVAVNHLASAEVIRAGQQIAIPGVGGGPSLRRPAVITPDPAPPSHRVVQGLQWPARGVMTSGFGWRRSHHHNGIDISAPRGAPIAAAMAGRVIFTGWYSGYGLAVIIDHGDGLITIYGHASKILVQTGSEVAVGETIALVGCTGNCTGPHLHFEVRVDGQPYNPLPYLP